MPFEIIHYGRVDTIPTLDPKTGKEIAAEGFITPQLSVHWQPGPGEAVQFGVKIDRKVIVETARLIESGNYGDDNAIDFYSAPMKRTELNEGIKAFRRARNARYGSDE